MIHGTREEKGALSRKSAYWWGGAFLLVLLAALPARLLPESEVQTMEFKYSLILPLCALACWVVGCVLYARSKGYPEMTGMLGVLCLPGILILLFLPDQWKQALDGPPRVSDLPPRDS